MPRHQVRKCAICLQEDDHPRIERVYTIPDMPDVNFHHDCYDGQVGEDDPIIHALIKGAAGKQGQELRDFIDSPEYVKAKAKLEAQLEGAKA